LLQNVQIESLGPGCRLRVFENRVLRRIFGPERDKITGEWRKLHYEELNGPYSSPSIVWEIKLRRMRWAACAASLGERRGVYRVLAGKCEGKRAMGSLEHRWGIILTWIFRKWDVGLWLGLSWLTIGTAGGHM
jgi:hypothetical protein